jgi:hypothetical protein
LSIDESKAFSTVQKLAYEHAFESSIAS